MTKEEMGVMRELDKKISDIHVVLLGIPDTEDKGMCGELAEISKEVRKNSDRSRSNTVKIAGLYGISAIVITVLLHLLGLY